MRRVVAVSALLIAIVTALLTPPGAPAAAQAGAASPAPATDAGAPVPAADDAAPLAAAFEAALGAGDVDAVAALFAPDARIKEHVAVLAAGPEGVAAWVRGCLLPDIQLVPGSRRLGGAEAAWEVRDALGCYRRARPDALRPAWDVAVAGGAIATLTLVYDPAWERRRLQAQAAPIRTAQATARAGRPAAAAPPTPAPPPPAAPGTQDRRTPSVAPWLAALAVALGGVGLLALLPRPREAP
jgi:hypothetical protein